ncbi:hypothetical protein EPO34_04690 [Patescibacteria group bacterium]|nr:MAG: hypothetical protein EPO34_04690 [Patescibacteria group bacterium]
MKDVRGFTNKEVLVIVGVVAVLFIAVVAAIDPARRLSQARDAARRRDVREVLMAAVSYAQEHGGAYPGAFDADPSGFQVLGTDRSGCERSCGTVVTGSACADLGEALGRLPFDPLTGSSGNTRYAVNLQVSGAVEVVACDPELAASISVKR